jgi:hypothetical protein
VTKRAFLLRLLLGLLFIGVAGAQYPILDMMTNKVIQKYQQSACPAPLVNSAGAEQRSAVQCRCTGTSIAALDARGPDCGSFAVFLAVGN